MCLICSDIINADHGLFADDVSSWANGETKTIFNVLQKKVNINLFCEIWCLKLNKKKQHIICSQQQANTKNIKKR